MSSAVLARQCYVLRCTHRPIRSAPVMPECSCVVCPFGITLDACINDNGKMSGMDIVKEYSIYVRTWLSSSEMDRPVHRQRSLVYNILLVNNNARVVEENGRV